MLVQLKISSFIVSTDALKRNKIEMEIDLNFSRDVWMIKFCISIAHVFRFLPWSRYLMKNIVLKMRIEYSWKWIWYWKILNWMNCIELLLIKLIIWLTFKKLAYHINWKFPIQKKSDSNSPNSKATRSFNNHKIHFHKCQHFSSWKMHNNNDVYFSTSL